MVIQEHGNLCNYILVKGESKGIIEVRAFKSEEVIYTKIRHKVTKFLLLTCHKYRLYWSIFK